MVCNGRLAERLLDSSAFDALLSVCLTDLVLRLARLFRVRAYSTQRTAAGQSSLPVRRHRISLIAQARNRTYASV
jgi:hypothetical protein